MQPAAASLLVVWVSLANMAAALEPITTAIATAVANPISTTIATAIANPISTTIIATAVAGGTWVGPKIFCHYKECCTPDWIAFNRAVLEADLERKLFGQHIASRVIVKAVSGFMNDEKRKKPLVLSLHGLNHDLPFGHPWFRWYRDFVSQLLAENIYKEGMDSKFYKYFDAKHHFPYKAKIDYYKEQLQESIKGSVTDCPTSMFVFDEMDKMHPDLMDSIASFLDYRAKLDGVSYGKAIFIFLSNAGGNTIVEKTLEFWTAGRDREEIQLKDLETTLAQEVFNTDHAYTTLIDKHLVDFFVPFLPLEYKHVVLCAKAEMTAMGLTPNQDLAEKVAKEELKYFPKSQKIFSVKGCKTIRGKLDYYL